MDGAAFRALVGAFSPYILALGIGMARALGLMAVLPVFTRLNLTGILRGTIAFAMALPLVPALVAQVQAAPAMGALTLTVLMAKEAFIGLLIGLLFSVPFWVAQVAGDLLDQQRGSQSAIVQDPGGDQASGITGTFLLLTLVTVFLLAGGMRFLFDALYESYRAWPPMQVVPHLSSEFGLRALALLDDVFRGGFLLASPLLIAMILAELSLGLISRFAPQLHVFDLALSVKGLIFIVGLPLYAVFLIGYMRDGLAPLASMAEQLRQFSQ